MEKVRKIVKTRKWLTFAALAAVVAVGVAVAAVSVKAASLISFIDNSNTNTSTVLSYLALSNESQDTAQKPFGVAVSSTSFNTDNLKFVYWTLTQSSSGTNVAVFKDNKSQDTLTLSYNGTVDGDDATDTSSASNTTAETAKQPSLYFRYAGHATLTAQPRERVQQTGALSDQYTLRQLTGYDSSTIEVLAPLSVTYQNDPSNTGVWLTQSTSNSSSNATDTNGSSITVTTAGNCAKFTTNAHPKNIQIEISKDGGVNYVTVEEGDIDYKDSQISVNTDASTLTKITIDSTGTIYIPTTVSYITAGNNVVRIRTKDYYTAPVSLNSVKNDEQRGLTRTFGVNVMPDFDKASSGTISSDTDYKNAGDKGGLYVINGEYYYIFSKSQVQNAETINISDLMNVIVGDGNIEFGYTSGSDTDVCLIETSGKNAGRITPNRAGVTEVYVKGSIKYYDTAGTSHGGSTVDKKLHVVVPYAKMDGSDKDNDIVRMNVGDTFEIKTTGGSRDLPGTVDLTDASIVANSSETPKIFVAKKAGEAEVKISFSTNGISQDNIDMLNKLYGTKDTSGNTYTGTFEELTYYFKVIDEFYLSDTELVVGTGQKVSITAYPTDKNTRVEWSWKVGTENGKETEGAVTFFDGDTPISNPTTKDEDSESLLQEISIQGDKVGVVTVTATQVVNGVSKSKTCIVTIVTAVDSISIDPSVIDVWLDGDDKTATATFRFDPSMPANKNVVWYSADDSIATVEWNEENEQATVTGVKGGTTNIYVVSQDGLKTGSAVVNVHRHVTGLSLDTHEYVGTLGGTLQLNTIITPTGEGVNRDVYWTSNNTAVATVENGLVTFKGTGTAVITCTSQESGAWLDTCLITVAVPIQSIELDVKDKEMTVGDVYRLSADITPSNATYKTVLWSSSDPTVAAVDPNSGLVTAVGKGVATIICTPQDPTYKQEPATCTITVKKPVESVTMNLTDYTMRKGTEIWLNATCSPDDASDKTIEWSVVNNGGIGDTVVCEVDQNGKVTGVNVGTAVVIAMNPASGQSATCTITVIQAVEKVTLNATEQTMFVGETYPVVATVYPVDAADKRCTFTSSDESIASVEVDESGTIGIVTALKGGTVRVVVVSEDSQVNAICTINVKEYVSSIDITDDEKYVSVGKSVILTATVGSATATNKNIVWSSSDNDICYVDQQGNVYGYQEGNVVITATAADGSGVVDTCIVHVVNPATSLAIDPSELHMLVGDSEVLRAIIGPDEATVQEVAWTSSNPDIVSVDEGGGLIANNIGYCTITATTIDGTNLKATCKVRVTQPISISSLKISSSDIYMLVGKQRQLSVRVRPVSNTDSYNWYSTDTGIVTVNGSGVVTTVGAGTADVYVESENNGVSSTCTIHVLGLSRTNMRLEQYDSNDLDVLGNESGTVTWRSSNPRIATVDSSGHVVGRMSGTCTITATAHDKTMTCTVTVFTAKKYN